MNSTSRVSILAERADDYVSFQIKPNLKVLGPRLGANLGKLTKWLGSADGSALRNAMLSQGSVEVNLDGAAAPIKLDANDLLVTLQAKPGFAAAEGNESWPCLPPKFRKSFGWKESHRDRALHPRHA